METSSRRRPRLSIRIQPRRLERKCSGGMFRLWRHPSVTTTVNMLESEGRPLRNARRLSGDRREVIPTRTSRPLMPRMEIVPVLLHPEHRARRTERLNPNRMARDFSNVPLMTRCGGPSSKELGKEIGRYNLWTETAAILLGYVEQHDGQQTVFVHLIVVVVTGQSAPE